MRIVFKRSDFVNPFLPRHMVGVSREPIVNQIDEATEAFFEFISIPNDNTAYFTSSYQRTGAQLWTEVNKLVKNLKGTGIINSTYDFWTDLIQYTPSFGISQLIAAANLRNPGVKDLDFFGAGWTFSGAGAKPSGASGTYASTNITPVELGTSFNIFRYNTTSALGTTATQMGAWNGSQGLFMHHASNSTTYTFAGITSTAGAVDPFSAGLQSLNRDNGVTRGSRRGIKVTEVAQTAVSNINVPLTHNCMNRTNGTQSLFSNVGMASAGIIGRSLTEDEVRVLNDIIEDFEIQLGRNYVAKRAWFFGDSIILGNGLSGGQQNRLSSRICLAKGWTEINRGVDGNTLLMKAPIDRLVSAPNKNFYQTTTPVFDPIHDIAFFIKYGVNDNGFYSYLNGSFVEETGPLFKSQCDEKIVQLKADGWPAQNIIGIFDTHCDESLNCWDAYASYDGGAYAGATNVSHNVLKTAGGEAMTEAGCVHVNPTQAMIDGNVQYISGDGIHPVSSPGHDVAATYILTTITHL